MSIQKTYSVLLCFLLWAQTAVLRAQTEGVGINTENLQGVFHVDAAGNNPSSGNTPASQQADDIVVTENGYVGIGTHMPSARLHIHTQGQASVFPLRIADGSQGKNKMLTSDNDGLASWQTPPPPPPSAVYDQQYFPAQNFPLGKETQATGNSVFNVPENGFYSVDITFWGEYNNGSSNTVYWTVTRLQLRKNGLVVDEFQINATTVAFFGTFVTLYAEALQGDILSIWFYPMEGYSAGLNVSARMYPAHYWMLSKFQYKRLGVNENMHYFN